MHVCITHAYNPLKQPPRGLPSKPFVTGPEAHLQSWFGGFELRQKYKTRKKIQQTTSAILRSRTFIWGADLPTGQRGAGFWLVSDGTLSRITARDPSAKSHMNYNLIWLFWAGVTNSADDSWSLGSVDALALDVEEEALVALEVGARAALLAVLPRVPHHLAGLVHLGNVVMGGLQGLSRCLRSSPWSTSS